MEFRTPNVHTHQVLHEGYYESTSSTPFASAPSSAGRALGPRPGFINGGFFYSAPASPMHFAMASSSLGSSMVVFSSTTQPSSPGFEFSEPSGPGRTGSIRSADEFFFDGKIRPMKLSTHLERPQVLAPLLDLEHEDDEEEEDLRANKGYSIKAGRRSSKRWVFLKDFLRSKSEGRSSNNNYHKLWSTISFSLAKEEKPKPSGGGESKKKKPMNGIGKRRVPPSPHELLYTANSAQAEEMRKKTFLPYRQGLLGCLGYSAMNGLARALNQAN
ncbi:dentin sialophosphoprotein-like [Hibiscus syriacus]|uniref:Dentin sialophosphoprotein-like n=1 Tax=Hibiscus syriacus TaxID=106335 RepID=A0A6A3BWF2_HIBSY|nr:uncharacterized protein LOC120208977 [Hibiscus syriacus]KAE8720925.1 dentin sialophosphoprotein-like [Hibiscus syriacus]